MCRGRAGESTSKYVILREAKGPRSLRTPLIRPRSFAALGMTRGSPTSNLSGERAFDRAAQLEACHCRHALRHRQCRARAQLVERLRPGLEGGPDAHLRRIVDVGTGLLLWDEPSERDRIVDRRDGLSAVANQQIRAGALRGIDRAEHDANLAMEIERVIRR